MSYNEIISNKLFVGDYETAKDLSTLEKLGVTHIVACGFNSGYFQHLWYVYLYIRFIYLFKIEFHLVIKYCFSNTFY